MKVPITSPRMIHDFPMTAEYVIIPDLPLEFKPKEAMKEGKFAFMYD
jgi:carotenoid cleavage dioxygenase-like enzyme